MSDGQGKDFAGWFAINSRDINSWPSDAVGRALRGDDDVTQVINIVSPVDEDPPDDGEEFYEPTRRERFRWWVADWRLRVGKRVGSWIAGEALYPQFERGDDEW